MDKFIKITYFAQTAISEFCKLRIEDEEFSTQSIFNNTKEVPCNLYINPAQITSVNARANYNLDCELVNYCTITLASGEMFFTLMTLDDISKAINNLTN